MSINEAAQRALRSLRTQVVTVVPEIDPDSVAPGASLTQLGCSSIERAEIVVLTMEDLGLNVPMSDLAAAQDVSSLVDVLGSHL